MAKNRSRRLRKKLHVDEFQENYVQIYFKIRPNVAEKMDVDAWCDFHDLLYDIVDDAGAQVAGGYSSGNKLEVAFTQYANQEDKTDAIVKGIREKVDVYLGSIYVAPPVDVWYWWGWDLDDPFDLLYSKSYLHVVA